MTVSEKSPAATDKQLLALLVDVDPETLSSATRADHSFRYIDISCASNGRLVIPSAETLYKDAPSRARRMIRSGDVLMSTVRPNLKAFAYCDLPSGDFVASTGFAVLRPHATTDARFILYCILSDDVARQIGAYTVGSNYPAINSTDVKRLRVPSFGHNKQRWIGKVLSTLDNTIEQTETLIEKYQKIKAGLMHDLFTRGVTLDGRLRPSRVEAPHLYKESQLGGIPREWNAAPLAAFAASRPGSFVNGPFGSDLLTRELREFGVPVIYVQDIKDDEYRRGSDAHVTEEKANELLVCNVRAGDVLVAKVGDPPGIAAAYFEAQRAVVTQDVIRIRPADSIVAQYLSGLLNSAVGRRAIRRISIEGTRARVSLTEFKRLTLPMPPHQEQRMIAERSSAVGKVLATLKSELSKLQVRKRGLMHDLLTGRVRVKTGEASAA